MKRIITLLLCVISLSVIGQESIFPSKIETTKEGKQRIPGTHLYIKTMPEDYMFVEQLCRFQKAEKQYIQFVEMNQNFKEKFARLSRETIEAAGGGKLRYYQKVDVNGMSGAFFGGPYTVRNEYQGVLVFGNEEISYMIVGVGPISDEDAFFEVVDLMQNIYYDAEDDVDPMELCGFDIDLSITGYQLNNTASSMFVFTPNGKEDGDLDYDSEAILAIQIPTSAPKPQKDFIKSVMNKAKKKGFIFESEKIKKIKLDGRKAYVLDTKATIGDVTTNYFIGSISCGDKAVLIYALGCKEGKDYSDLYKRTLSSIKLKQ